VKPNLAPMAEETSDPKLYWTPGELAEMLKLHLSTVIRLFQDEPGVLKLNKRRILRGSRPHVTLRIPDHVLQRKLREWK
jgi:hypothetical protein